MHHGLKRLLGCLCAFLIAFSSTAALAEFSPRLDALRQQDAVTIELTGRYDLLGKLSKGSLETVNKWLEKLQVTLEGRLAGAMAAVSVSSDGEEVLAVSSREREEGVVTEFRPSGGAYWTGVNQKNALALLTDEENHFFDPMELPTLYAKLAAALYPVLETKATPKTKATRTTVKNAAASTSYTDYIFTGAAMNDIWPEVLEAVLPVLKDALSDQPERSAQLEALLKGVIFSGECRFKRLLDKDKGDMGLQFTGNAAKGSDQRKVTLFGGYTKDKGGYLSLKLKPVKGKNNLTFQLSCALTKAKTGVRTLKADVNYSRTFDKTTESIVAAASLKNTVKGDDEKWSGKITVTEESNKVKTIYTITPDLDYTDAGLSGTVAVQRKVKNKVNMKATLQVKVTESAQFTPDEPARVTDLRGLSVSRAKAKVQAELPTLTRLVTRLMSTLSAEERALLTHELRTERWMEPEPTPTPTPRPTATPAPTAKQSSSSANWSDATEEEEEPAPTNDPEEGEDEDPVFFEESETGDSWEGGDWFVDDDE